MNLFLEKQFKEFHIQRKKKTQGFILNISL